MIAEMMRSKLREDAWILGFVHGGSLKSNKNWDLIVIAPSETQ
jgi:hypothetical protein